MKALPYELPVSEVEPVWSACPECGERYMVKVRMTAPAPYNIACLCGHTFTVDPRDGREP